MFFEGAEQEITRTQCSMVCLWQGSGDDAGGVNLLRVLGRVIYTLGAVEADTHWLVSEGC